MRGDKVLRVNRSLAAMIGVAPSELIGVNMRALLALTSESALYSCPFLRATGEQTMSSFIPRWTAPTWSPTSRGAWRFRRKPANDSCTQGITDRREAERRLPRIVRQHSGGSLLQYSPQGASSK